MNVQISHAIALPDHLQATLDEIMARNRARFGHDAFRMEGDGGESGAGDGAGDGDTGDQDGAGDGDAGDDSKKTGDDAKSAAGKVEDLPDWAQKLIKDTRGEAAEHRTKATAAERKLTDQLDGIAKALGLKEDEKTDPAKLASELTKAQDQARQTAVELAVYRSSAKHQGDPDALLDSRGFLAKLADLDPTDAKFAAKVETAIKDAVKDNPKLKAVQAAGSSSADHGAGGSGEGSKRTPKSLTDAVGGHYGT
jgi:hypothetical protein